MASIAQIFTAVYSLSQMVKDNLAAQITYYETTIACCLLPG